MFVEVLAWQVENLQAADTLLHCQLLAIMWATVTGCQLSSSYISFTLLRISFSVRSAAVVLEYSLDYSIRYSIEYLSSKLLDSGAALL